MGALEYDAPDPALAAPARPLACDEPVDALPAFSATSVRSFARAAVTCPPAPLCADAVLAAGGEGEEEEEDEDIGDEDDDDGDDVDGDSTSPLSSRARHTPPPDIADTLTPPPVAPRGHTRAHGTMSHDHSTMSAAPEEHHRHPRRPHRPAPPLAVQGSRYYSSASPVCRAALHAGVVNATGIHTHTHTPLAHVLHYTLTIPHPSHSHRHIHPLDLQRHRPYLRARPQRHPP
jgi:hypothetical protein